MIGKRNLKECLIIVFFLACTALSGYPLAEGSHYEIGSIADPLRLQAGLSLSHPVPNGRISQSYDHIRCGVGDEAYHHTGIDYGSDEGTNTDIFAAGDGVVVPIPKEVGKCGGPTGRDRKTPGNNHGLGNTVIVEHNSSTGPIYTMYSHLSQILVREKQPVERGKTIIGKMGQDCTDGGVHLHFELKSAPVLESPRGSSCGRGGTCTGDTGWPCYGYAKGSSADNYGYYNPLNFIDSTTCSNGTSVSTIDGRPPVHPDGTLMKASDDPKVYVLQNGWKILIPDPVEDRLRNLYSNGGFALRDIVTVDRSELNSYPTGGQVTGPLPSNGKREPTGRLIRPQGGSANPQEISIVTASGGRRVFYPYIAFLNLGFAACNAKPVPDYDSYPIDGPIVDGRRGQSGPSDFTIAANPPVHIIDAGSSTSYLIATATTSGSPQTINLEVNGLPLGATASFSPETIISGNTSTLTIYTSTSTPEGEYTITITGRGTTIRSDTVFLVVENLDPGRPVVTSSLRIATFGPYTVGQTVTAEFTLTNRGTSKAKIDTLTVGGRLNGDSTCSGGCPDFTFAGPLTIKPGKSYSYTGTQTFNRAGDYVFFIAYKPRRHDWVTSVPTDPGMANSLRITVHSVSANTPVINTIMPSNPIASAGYQNVRVFGSNFEQGLEVSMTLPNGQVSRLGGSQIIDIAPSSFVMVTDFNRSPGNYTIQAINPGDVRSNAFSFVVQSIEPRPMIDSINPTSVLPSTFTLIINGRDFDSGAIDEIVFPNGFVGSGAANGGLISRSNTQLVVRETMSGVGSGTYRVRVKNSDGRRSNEVNLMVVDPLLPQVNSISPMSVSPSTFTLTINGDRFDSGAADEIVFPNGFVGSGVDAGRLISRSANQLVVREVMDGVGPGTYRVRVRNSDGSRSNEVTLTVTPPTPLRITQINPNTVNKGTTVTFTLTGEGFQSGFTATLINEHDQPFPPISTEFVNSTSVRVRFSIGTGPTSMQTIRITNPDGQIDSIQFQALGSLRITSISPTSVAPSTFTLTINGTGFDGGAADEIVFPNGFVGSGVDAGRLISRSPTQLVVGEVMDGVGAGSYRVRVRNSDGQRSNEVTLTVTSPGPQISSINPTSIEGKTFTLTINGSGFDPNGAIDEIVFPNGFVGSGTANGGLVSRSSTQIVVTERMAGAAPGNYTVKVKNPDGQRSNGVILTLISVVSVSPSSGSAGTQFSYQGNGFTKDFWATSHLRKPDGTEFPTLRIATNSSGQFTHTINSTGFAPGTYEVWAIDDNTGISSAHVTFTVTGSPPPQVNSINPTSVAPSTFTLTINGRDFDSGAIDEIVFPNGFVGSGAANGGLISRSNTQLVVRETMSGVGSGTYRVRVKNLDGQRSNEVTLTVTPPPPTQLRITQINPSTVNKGTTVTFTLTGEGFQSGFNATLINELGQEFNITQKAFTSSTSVQVTAFIGPGPTSTQTIRITNPDGQTASIQFQAIGTQLTITQINPSTVNKGTTVTFTLTGTGFQSGFTATLINELGQQFNITQKEFVSSTTVRVTAFIGSGPTSTQTIRITNPDGQSASITFQALAG
ncbi:MAG: IPT/TIG domain-containing protein [Acidobacteriota bacterium]